MKAISSLMSLIAGLPLLAHAAWSPPENPDPQKISQEASKAVMELQYSWLPRFDEAAANEKKADALARFVWFEQNGVKLQPTLLGVRDSFVVGSWHSLAAMYPPALTELNAARDRAVVRVRDSESDAKEVRSSFSELAAIDRQFDAESKTTEEFTWLDANRPELAKQVYPAAQSALIQNQRYALCGKYLEPEKTLRAQIRFYRWSKDRMAKQESNGIGDYPASNMGARASENIYENNTAILVALLVLNDRKDEAAKIAEQALKESDAIDYRTQMDKALAGQLPEAWQPKPGVPVLSELHKLLMDAFVGTQKRGI